MPDLDAAHTSLEALTTRTVPQFRETAEAIAAGRS
jgi:hypothetical protein